MIPATTLTQRFTALALGFALVGSAACGDSTTGTGGVGDDARLVWTKTAELTLADSCGEAEQFFRQAAVTQMELELEQNRRCSLEEGGCMLRDAVAASEGSVDGPSAQQEDDETPDEYSTTNTQVEGVDEADFVKSTGTRIYALFGRDLVVLKSWPAAETGELGRVKIKGSPGSFYLYQDKIVLFSSTNYYDHLPASARPNDGEGEEKPATPGEEYADYWWRGATLVTTVDISDERAPTIVSEELIDGDLLSSRRVDGRVYLAQLNYARVDGLSTWPSDLHWDAPAAEIDAAFDALHTKNLAIIEALPLSHWMPSRYALDADGIMDPEAGVALTSCDQVYRPSVFSGGQVVSVVTLDLDADTVHGTSIVGDWGTVYASRDALYIGSTNWRFYWWWEGAAEVPPLMTQIHKFAFGDDGQARYVASGSVPGYALNQFSFDEYDGRLRVATTEGFGWWNTSDQTDSRVSVLEQDGARLNVVGSVDGLGAGEQIQSVRFRGDKGYVVTFRQTDPLYVLDLSTPSAPAVLGELKVPGFSSYIHALDDEHLLTIGRDATDEGQIRGLQFQIFDVSDPTHPVASHKTVIGDDWSTWSDASWDHHAFVYFPARELLAVPVSGWEPDEGQGYWDYRSAVFLFKISLDTGITPLGQISHVDLLPELGVNTSCRAWYGWWEAQVRRGIFVEDYIYTLSNLGVRVHDTRDLAAGPVAAELCIDPSDFNGGQPYYDPCYEVGVDAREGDD